MTKTHPTDPQSANYYQGMVDARLASPRAVIGLQLAVAILVARLVIDIIFQIAFLELDYTTDTAIGLGRVAMTYRLFATPFFALLLGVGYWWARTLPGGRKPFTFLAVAQFALFLFTVAIAIGQHFLLEHYPYRLVFWVRQVLTVSAVAGVLWGAWCCGGKALQRWMLITGGALLLWVVHVLAINFWPNYAEWLFKSWSSRLLDYSVDGALSLSIALLLLRCLRQFEATAGSWSQASLGLSRYRTSILWSISLSVGVVVLGFLGAFVGSVGMLKFTMIVGSAAALPISVHAMRGLYGFAQQPTEVRGTVPALVGAALFLFVLIIQCEMVYRVPEALGWRETDSYFLHGRREALSVLEAGRTFSNWLSLAALLAVTWALVRVATYLKERELAQSCTKLGGLFFFIIAAMAGLRFAVAKVSSRGTAELLVIASIAFLIVAVVAVIWYLGVLAKLGAHIEAHISKDQLADPPRAVAREIE